MFIFVISIRCVLVEISDFFFCYADKRIQLASPSIIRTEKKKIFFVITTSYAPGRFQISDPQCSRALQPS